jgi:hypothetical protein
MGVKSGAPTSEQRAREKGRPLLSFVHGVTPVGRSMLCPTPHAQRRPRSTAAGPALPALPLHSGPPTTASQAAAPRSGRRRAPAPVCAAPAGAALIWRFGSSACKTRCWRRRCAPAYCPVPAGHALTVCGAPWVCQGRLLVCTQQICPGSASAPIQSPSTPTPAGGEPHGEVCEGQRPLHPDVPRASAGRLHARWGGSVCVRVRVCVRACACACACVHMAIYGLMWHVCAPITGRLAPPLGRPPQPRGPWRLWWSCRWCMAARRRGRCTSPPRRPASPWPYRACCWWVGGQRGL